VCAGQSEAALEKFRIELQGRFDGHVCITWIDKCRVKRNRKAGTRGPAREHFGFVDGISQPVFFPDDANGRKDGWESHYNPSMPLAEALIPDPLAAGEPGQTGNYGSFMAYLDIEQHKNAFDKAAKHLAAQLKVKPPAGKSAKQYAEALIIGRFKDGMPVIPDRKFSNDFDRADDLHAKNWAFASHICKMNPREGDDGSRRFIIRRGVTYERKGQRVGLIFQSFQASLTAQFETLLSSWAGNPHHPRTGTGRDPILGDGKEKQCFPNAEGVTTCISGLTTVRGGEYFYFPSIPGIRSLAKRRVSS
jgi:deferrochelatase/peroxidase EfeB